MWNKERLPKVVIVTARCSKTKKMFGIRMQEQSRGQWLSTWAFSIEEEAAKREGYEQAKIKGDFFFDDNYPGCPDCKATGVFQCDCHGLSCWDQKSNRVRCPTCNSDIEIGGRVTELRAGGDR
jgi:hypothetical protein